MRGLFSFRLAGCVTSRRAPSIAPSARSESNTFSHGPGDSWPEVYRYDDGNMENHYVPGESTCQKHGEQGEYFDFSARILLSGPQGVQGYSRIGACGR